MELKENQRPIAYLKTWYKIDAMIDTGALIPVWTRDEKILLNLGGKLIQENIKFRGFGGRTQGNLYCISNFIMGKLLFTKLYVIAHADNELPCHMILSATMFRNLMYEIDDKNHKLNVTIPDGESEIRNLIIRDSNGKLHVLVQSE